MVQCQSSAEGPEEIGFTFYFVTRAVQTEVIQALDTNSFINALITFTNYRGKLDHITSGCGNNFEDAAKELETRLGKINEFAVKEKPLLGNFIQ